MATLPARSRLTRALRCPQCRQPWLPQRRLFSPSALVLWDPMIAANLNKVIRETENERINRPKTRQIRNITNPEKGRLGSGLDRRQMKNQSLVFGQTTEKPIRTRFAPSPTGYLHLGSLRTALFNNLASVASNGGSFILRIEDTDQKRLVPGAEERIIEDLRWLGLEWSEGPDCGGPHGPYRQSERLEIYRSHVQQLIDKGYAYRCFCKGEDLEKQKLLRHEAGLSTFYPGTCRSVEADDAKKRAAAGEPHTVRFRGDAFGILGLKDAIYGRFQKKEPEEDFIILKTDGYPTYHLANVVDDHLMKITHVVRGEEWLISTPKHLALYKAFGWDPPTFAHLGLLVNEDGSKLSKRNESADVSRYKKEGYTAMPMQAWLANLGSSFVPGYRAMPRTMDEVAKALTFKFTKGGIKLNPEKLDGFEVKYHQAMIADPSLELYESESKIIEDKILRPVWDEVQRLTPATQGPFRGHAGVMWEGAKTLVPMLQSEDTRMLYLRRIFEAMEGRYKHRGDMLRLVRDHPYYFWRVPTTLYKRGLLDPGDHLQLVINSLFYVTGTHAFWVSGDKKMLVDEMKRHIYGAATDPIASEHIYRQHRFVAAGDHNVSTHDASTMFAILGHEEWQHRVKEVASKAELLNENRFELAQKWLDEAHKCDPEWVNALTCQLSQSIEEAGLRQAGKQESVQQSVQQTDSKEKQTQ